MRGKVVVRAIVLNDNDEVLLLRRDKNDDSRPGDQDFPGGGVDEDEDLTAAVCHEVFEEAGLTVAAADMQLFFGHTEVDDGMSVTRLVFFATVHNPVITLSSEHDGYQWVPADKVSTEFRHPVYGASVDYAFQHDLFKQ